MEGGEVTAGLEEKEGLMEEAEGLSAQEEVVVRPKVADSPDQAQDQAQHQAKDQAQDQAQACGGSSRVTVRPGGEVTRSVRDKHGRFSNPWPTWRFPSPLALGRWYLLEKDHSSVPSSLEVLDRELPVMKPYFLSEPSRRSGAEPGLRVTWLGHASVLVEMGGLVVLTDPMFSQRASPTQLAGPRRYRGPPCSVAQLPRLDAVLISHNHYDHLDTGSVAELNARFGAELRWFVPLGLLDWMRKSGCQNVIELDWWEENCVPGHAQVTFAFTPAQHWCKRTLWDADRVLWGSWVVVGPAGRFFFAGDTGYCSSFLEIGGRYGPFDLAAIPIGAYLPRDIMQGQHVDPEEAVQIHQDVRARHSLGVHWGTFALAYEHYLDPPVKLREAMEKKGLNVDNFFTLHHGESRLVITANEVFE